jgi:hypothetical protein
MTVATIEVASFWSTVSTEKRVECSGAPPPCPGCMSACTCEAG